MPRFLAVSARRQLCASSEATIASFSRAASVVALAGPGMNIASPRSSDPIRSGRTRIEFNNLALIFLEGQNNAHAEVVGRFMYFAKSTGPLGPRTGSLIKKLQLVE